MWCILLSMDFLIVRIMIQKYYHKVELFALFYMNNAFSMFSNVKFLNNNTQR